MIERANNNYWADVNNQIEILDEARNDLTEEEIPNYMLGKHYHYNQCFEKDQYFGLAPGLVETYGHLTPGNNINLDCATISDIKK